MGKPRILIVDDEASLARLLKLNLEQLGQYEVRIEHEGRRALDVAKEFEPDLILLDVIMPDLDGGAVASQIQAEPRLKATPIVFLTAIVSSQEARHGVIGGHPFLAKPVSMDELLQCIDKQLYA